MMVEIYRDGQVMRVFNKNQFIRVSDGKHLPTPKVGRKYEIGEKLVIDKQFYEVVPFDSRWLGGGMRTCIDYVFVKKVSNKTISQFKTINESVK